MEQDWSGRGQHAEFEAEERDSIDAILKVRDTLGTYTIRNELSILIFPVAECDLEHFLNEKVQPNCIGDPSYHETFSSLTQFPICLINAIAYIHANMTKHMDIKPRNLLVRYMRRKSEDDLVLARYKIYIADFGIARSYKSIEATETEGPTSFTRKYAAPEVVDREKRGLSADVFSLGCVFTEIFASMVGHIETKEEYRMPEKRKRSAQNPLERLRTSLCDNEVGDASYQANLPTMNGYFRELRLQYDLDILRFNRKFSSGLRYAEFLDLVQQMISKEPAQRPSATDLAFRLGSAWCCEPFSDPLEAEEKRA
ncbi:hypothetical protein N0V90_000336 [Kalmusia sp. IMI 367209]|nr:hypothetical protein N0V90_000336 [Kalmusia sp. IMI 367209]